MPYYIIELQTPASLKKKLLLTFFECLELESSQDVNGILDAIKVAFEKFSISSLLNKEVFLSSDGASVNSGKKSGLISLFREQNEWMTFI